MVPPSHSRISRYHGWVTRRPGWVVAGALIIGVVATLLAMQLKLKTSFAELLPSNDPGVVALTRTQKRLGDLSLLLIGIRSPDRDANLRYAEALTQKLRALPPNVVNLATYHVRDVREFFQKNKWLYVSEADLESIRDRLRTEISKRKNPLFVSLGDDDESVESMRQRMSSKTGLDEKFPGGVFTSKGAGGEYVWIAALPPGGLFVENAGEALLDAANDLIKDDPPTRYHPEMKVEPAGPIVTGIASRHAVERDILSVTITCLTIVAISIGLYFRRLRSIPLTGIPAAMGTVMAFAVAALAFGYLNSSTAFLGSIIIGNGINYAIILMSRYEEHRARGSDPNEALRCALGGTWRGTLVASIAASASYASLTVTSFRGFSQFGVMGATGVLFCWLATYSILPAMLWWLDQPRVLSGWRGALWRVHPLVWCLAIAPPMAAGGYLGWMASNSRDALAHWQVQNLGAAFPKLTAALVLLLALALWAVPVLVVAGRLILRKDANRGGSQATQALPAHAPLEFGPLARFLRRRAGAVTAAFAVLGVLSVVGLRHFLKDPFEYDFRKLNAKLATTEESQQFNRNLSDLFGRWPSPTILLADAVDEVEPLKAAIRRQDREAPGKDVIGQIVTIFDLLPGAPEVQRRKLEILAQIRKLTHDPALVVLNEKEKADLAKIDPSPDLHELTPQDLPPIARRPFTEVDGAVGKVVLVYPPEQGISVWNGRDLLRIASVLQTIRLDNGKVIETSGFAVVFGSMIRSVLHDGPIATIASLIAVLIIVSFTIRPAAAALMALSTLALGVLLMMGGAGWARVHVTFLNFIALPITFGIGAEYALNVVTRYREERNVSRAVVSTGAAVALCSWTTIVGYGSLLAASNQALQGFGMMAIIGEVVCLAAAIVALPAVLFWRHARPFDEAPRATNGTGTIAPALPSDREEPPTTAI
jgi:predicted RND superfamily exporter protein